MNILWLNLRKRGRNRAVAAALERFAAAANCHLLLLQETTSKIGTLPHSFHDFRPVYVSSDLSAFARVGIGEIAVTCSNSFLLGLNAAGLSIFNVHLSPYRSLTRQQELQFLQALVQREGGDTIIGGDFNLAPRPADGLMNDLESNWTKPPERQAFERLTRECYLLDLLCSDVRQEYSIERSIAGDRVRFRCDLILCSQRLKSVAKAHYLHETRTGPWAISDHSGMVLALDGRSPK